MIDSTTRSLGAVVAPLPGPPPTPPLRPSPAAPTPPAHPFAELLRQNRLAAAGPAAATPKPEVAHDEDHAAPIPATDASPPAAPETAPPQREATATATGTKGRPAAASRDAPRSPAADASARPADASEDERGARPADAGAAPTQAPDATALAGVVAAARPDGAGANEALTGERSVQAQAATIIDASRRLDAANDSAAAGASSPAGSWQADASAPSAAPQRDARASIDAAAQRRGADVASALHEPAIASFADALTQAKATPEPRSALPGDPAGAAAAALAPPGAALASVASGSDATTLTASLATPVDAPDFAATFGAQVSVFVREGVQHAELHLHPADMGPVSISITLDGTQARVDFGADVAATRQAIESGLPELASALSDAGFTLAGGGVAQHSRSGSGDGGDTDANRSPQARHSPARDASVDVDVATRRIAAGGVDVYA